MSRNFQGYFVQFLHTVFCSVYSKNLKHYKKVLMQNILLFRGSRSEMHALNSGLFKNFLKLRGKYLSWSLYLIKLLDLQHYWKRDIGVSCKFYKISKSIFFIEVLGVAASESLNQAVYLKIDVKMASIVAIFLTVLATLKMF